MQTHIDHAARFWSKVAKTDGCWLWNGSTGRRGYGKFSMNDKTYIAHRVAFTFAGGVIPDGMFVCHRCDNPRCVRPGHLFTGTHQENMADMMRKGRKPPGHCRRRVLERRATKRTGRPGLTPEQAAEVYRLHAAGAFATTLARQYGVSKTTIHRVLNRCGRRRS